MRNLITLLFGGTPKEKCVDGLDKRGKFRVIKWKFEKDYEHGRLKTTEHTNRDFKGTTIRLLGEEYTINSISKSGLRIPESDCPVVSCSTNYPRGKNKYILLNRLSYEILKSLYDSNKNTFECDYTFMGSCGHFNVG